MSLINYTLPFGGGTPNWATISPIPNSHATAVNNLLYGGQPADPNDLEQTQGYNPFSAPAQTAQNYYTQTRNNNYLPPPPQQQPSPQQPPSPQSLAGSSLPSPSSSTSSLPMQQTLPQSPFSSQPALSSAPNQMRSYGEGSYSQIPSRNVQNNKPFYNSNNSNNFNNNNNNNEPNQIRYNQQMQTQQQSVTPSKPTISNNLNNNSNNNNKNNNNSNKNTVNNKIGDMAGDNYPIRPPGFTRVQAGQGSRTQVHAVLDYDDDDEDDYYDGDDDGTPVNISDEQKNSRMPTLTPIQGPIFLKNGTVPTIPLFSYPQVNNGTFIQIPIWWTALSVALGLNIRGDVIRGVPCVKRFHQLFCPTAGNSYPIDKIETFIDENKALMKRMYGDFEMNTGYGPPLQQNKKKKRNAARYDDVLSPELMDLYGPPGTPPEPVRDSYFSKLRNKRQSQNFSRKSSNNNNNANTANNSANNQNTGRTGRQNVSNNQSSENTGRVDACESKIEIVTPYWASNSAGKIRAIVNTQHFEQAIHQEVCSKTQTSRCAGDCGCEQKYKWHRLLAYDPDNDCRGIFMDWFLFPSCCVCRCNPL